MTPRPYTQRKRREAADSARERVLGSARQLLHESSDEPFSVDAVAKRAGVSRMTIYNQFGSKTGMLEALFDSLVEAGPIQMMPRVFANPDARVALDEFIGVMGAFWTSSRGAHLKLRAAAIFDPELAVAVRARAERLRHGLDELVRRLGDEAHPVVPRAEVVDVLFVLLGFDTFDAMAGPERDPRDVVPMMRRVVRATLGMEPSTTAGRRARS